MKAKKKKTTSANSPIKIRFRKLSDGRQSIFLDSTVYNLATGEENKSERHTYKFLGLFLVPESTPFDAQSNKQTLQLVEDMVRQMTEKYSRERLGVISRRASKGNFVDYVSAKKEKAMADGRTDFANALGKMLKRLVEYASSEILFAELDVDFLGGFIDFLKTVEAGHNYPFKTPRKLAGTTIRTLYTYLRLMINHAYKDGLIIRNPTKEFSLQSKLTIEEHERAFLEIPELQAFMRLETKYELEKRAFIFACLCGLRSSDIRQLTWDTFIYTEEGVSVSITMEKTEKPLYLPISANAMKWLPERGSAKGSDPVFPLYYEGLVNRKLKIMTKQLGIDKHIPFHCSRHTFATMMLTLGVDIYTVSKLLGHSSVEQTLVYARLIDKKKEDAVKRIPSLTTTETA